MTTDEVPALDTPEKVEAYHKQNLDKLLAQYKSMLYDLSVEHDRKIENLDRWYNLKLLQLEDVKIAALRPLEHETNR